MEDHVFGGQEGGFEFYGEQKGHEFGRQKSFNRFGGEESGFGLSKDSYLDSHSLKKILKSNCSYYVTRVDQTIFNFLHYLSKQHFAASFSF